MPKLRVHIKDNNSSPHGKFYRFLFPFSSKFSDLNLVSYVLSICSCDTHSEPGLPVISHLYAGGPINASSGFGPAAGAKKAKAKKL